MKEYRQHKFEVPQGATEIILVRHGELRGELRGESRGELWGESRAATADNPFLPFLWWDVSHLSASETLESLST